MTMEEWTYFTPGDDVLAVDRELEARAAADTAAFQARINAQQGQ
jgi:hypothetical protein